MDLTQTIKLTAKQVNGEWVVIDNPQYKLDKVQIEKLLRGFSVTEYISERFSNYDERYKESAIKGFLLCEQMNKRKFDEDDLMRAMGFAAAMDNARDLLELKQEAINFIQSLQNPTYTIEVEAEEKCSRCYSNNKDECWSAKECSDGRYDLITPKQTNGVLNVIKIEKK